MVCKSMPLRQCGLSFVEGQSATLNHISYPVLNRTLSAWVVELCQSGPDNSIANEPAQSKNVYLLRKAEHRRNIYPDDGVHYRYRFPSRHTRLIKARAKISSDITTAGSTYHTCRLSVVKHSLTDKIGIGIGTGRCISRGI